MAVEIQKNVSLKAHNTFAVDVNARHLARVKDSESLGQIIRNADAEPWILGGGSNMLLTKEIDKLVLKIEIGGIEIVEDLPDAVLIKVGAGVIWHDLVLWAVERGYGGIENLALIPGRVGAAPIQNIGAYGIELKSVFHYLEAIDLHDGGITKLYNEACDFGYRDSVFKNAKKGNYCITHVYLKLNKTPHQIHAGYGAINSMLEQKGVSNPSIKHICNAVVEIRAAKLPDPAVLGNSGSFFKNPVVTEKIWADLLDRRPDLVYYAGADDTYKIPAGWLIEQCGWKGKRLGNVGCYEKQALVIVNYGGASGQEILDHAIRVQESVREEFGIALSREVNVF